MTLIRTFARIDGEGRILLPTNIKKFAGLVEGEVVELRLVGADGRILISKKEPKRVGVRKVAVH
ncbi:MAG TPA: hypothetical protein ACFYED_03345 [Candidatus Tripitaka californicus]|uniref:hypothetical protein n=1 Tax=Candidatus Tripitaka californicus TaxID=3367616 RepID=UPI00402757E0|nr:hypothetical protein [Planctomycetota bacterium]